MRFSTTAAHSTSSQLADWIDRVALERVVPGDAEKRTVRAALDEERSRLLALPEHPFVCDHVRLVSSGKTPYLRFDGNDYSIPHTLTRKPLTLVASDTLVRVLDGNDEIARHARSWEKGKQIEDDAHLRGLSDQKRKSREHRGRNRLIASCPSAEAFLSGVARSGGHLGGTTTRLLHLLEQYRAAELETALAEATHRGAFHAHAVAHVLEQRQRANKRPAPSRVVLPDDPRVRDLVVEPRSLGVYDALADTKKDDSDD